MTLSLAVRRAAGKTGEIRTEVFSFNQPAVCIGRAPGSDIVLSNRHRTVSRKHAEIRLHDDAYCLVDLGSKNITRLNGQQLIPGRGHEIRHGDRISIGDFDIEVGLSASSLYPQPDGSSLLATVYGRPSATVANEVKPSEDTYHRTVEELIVLSELAFDVSVLHDLHEIAETILSRAVRALQAEHGVISLLENESGPSSGTLIRVGGDKGRLSGLDETVLRWMKKHKSPLRLPNPGAFAVPDEPSMPEGASSVLCLPLLVRSRLIGIIALYDSTRSRDFSNSDERLLAIIAAQSAQVIENARLREKEEHLARVREDLSLAKNIQLNLLPRRAPQVDGYDIAGRNLPAQIIGGDFFDFLTLADGHLGFCVGDISGKGLPAALMMANVQATLRGQAYSSPSVGACMRRTNRLLYETAPKNTFITLWCGLLNPATGEVRFGNAGHTKPLKAMANGELEILPKGGLVLGVVREQSVRERIMRIDEGDVFVLYSDGVTEAMSPNREEFGEDRLHDLVSRNTHLSAEQLIDLVVDSVASHAGAAPQSDDITLVVIKRLSSGDRIRTHLD